METLKAFYDINQLVINTSKTAIVCFENSKRKIPDDEISITTDEGNIVKPVKSHKVLGWLINKRLSMDSQLGASIRAAGLKMKTIMEFTKYMNIQQKAKVFKAHVMSIYSYGISQYAGETEALKQRLHVSIMNQC